MTPMGQIAATTVGSLALEVLAASNDGHVCGVFSAGFAIEVSDLAIVLSTDPWGWPLGIGLGALPTARSRNWLGLAVRSSPRSLDLHDVGFHIDLSQAAVWDGAGALSGLAPSPAMIGQAHTLARTWLSEHPSATGIGEAETDVMAPRLPPGRLFDRAFERHIGSSLDQLVQGLRAQDQALWSTAVEGLLGAGPGLTPAGDDMVSGVLYALQSAGADSIPGLPELMDFIPRRAASRTTIFGRSLLHAACLGHPPELVIGALDALFALPSEVPNRLAALVRMGATSGHDTLVGLAAGLDLLAHPGPPG